jgi:hypothetical protein
MIVGLIPRGWNMRHVMDIRRGLAGVALLFPDRQTDHVAREEECHYLAVSLARMIDRAHHTAAYLEPLAAWIAAIEKGFADTGVKAAHRSVTGNSTLMIHGRVMLPERDKPSLGEAQRAPGSVNLLSGRCGPAMGRRHSPSRSSSPARFLGWPSKKFAVLDDRQVAAFKLWHKAIAGWRVTERER